MVKMLILKMIIHSQGLIICGMNKALSYLITTILIMITIIIMSAPQPINHCKTSMFPAQPLCFLIRSVLKRFYEMFSTHKTNKKKYPSFKDNTGKSPTFHVMVTLHVHKLSTYPVVGPHVLLSNPEEVLQWSLPTCSETHSSDDLHSENAVTQ